MWHNTAIVVLLILASGCKSEHDQILQHTVNWAKLELETVSRTGSTGESDASAAHDIVQMQETLEFLKTKPPLDKPYLMTAKLWLQDNGTIKITWLERHVPVTGIELFEIRAGGNRYWRWPKALACVAAWWPDESKRPWRNTYYMGSALRVVFTNDEEPSVRAFENLKEGEGFAAELHIPLAIKNSDSVFSVAVIDMEGNESNSVAAFISREDVPKGKNDPTHATD